MSIASQLDNMDQAYWYSMGHLNDLNKLAYEAAIVGNQPLQKGIELILSSTERDLIEIEHERQILRAEIR
jgi:hypothetical protein